MISTALVRIPVGVVVQRHRAQSRWLDFLWKPVAILPGVPSAAPWTLICQDEPASTFYAGDVVIELHRSETANYRENLASKAPLLWVVLRATAAEPAFDVLSITADPATGEALTGAGNDLIETVAMPDWFGKHLQAFVTEHHVEQPTYRRKRDRAGQAARRSDDRSEEEP